MTSEALVLPTLVATSKDDAIDQIVGHVASVVPGVDAAVAAFVLRDRERAGSTGVGGGLAIPHGKIQGLERVVGCFARSVDGVDFAAIDEAPVHLFFAVLAPPQPKLHLKALARASRLFKSTELRRDLIEAPDRATLWSLLLSEDEQLTVRP